MHGSLTAILDKRSQSLQIDWTPQNHALPAACVTHMTHLSTKQTVRVLELCERDHWSIPVTGNGEPATQDERLIRLANAGANATVTKYSHGGQGASAQTPYAEVKTVLEARKSTVLSCFSHPRVGPTAFRVRAREPLEPA
jgi:hypothetical protein